MNNDEVYARGLLNKALDPSTQPPAIRSFLHDELHLVRRLIPAGSQVLDFGCGMGRHLIDLGNHVAVGVGFDYERAYIAEAHKLGSLQTEFETLRGESLATLRAAGLKPNDLALRGRQPDFGPVTLGQLLATWAVHDLDHIGQIARVMSKNYSEAHPSSP